MKTTFFYFCIVALGSAVIGSSPTTSSAEDFYKGKTVLDITYVSADEIEQLVSKTLGISQKTKDSLGFLVRGTKKQTS